MARVQLYLQPPRGAPVFRFSRPGGLRVSIPALWIFTCVDLMSHVRPGQDASAAAFPECVVDTGCHLSAIPERVWGQFRPGAVTPLPFDPAMPQSLRFVSLAGGRWPYDLGELTIRIRDLVGGSMDVRVVAQLIRDNGNYKAPMILGLRGGVIDGRILRGEPDAAAPHGQAWTLEGP